LHSCATNTEQGLKQIDFWGAVLLSVLPSAFPSILSGNSTFHPQFPHATFELSAKRGVRSQSPFLSCSWLSCKLHDETRSYVKGALGGITSVATSVASAIPLA